MFIGGVVKLQDFGLARHGDGIFAIGVRTDRCGVFEGTDLIETGSEFEVGGQRILVRDALPGFDGHASEDGGHAGAVPPDGTDAAER